MKRSVEMRYREHLKTGDFISEIGFGSSYIFEVEENKAIETLRYAYEKGINYFDLAAGGAAAFPKYGKAFHDIRDKVFFQIHFGADYTTGDYGWSLDLETVKKSINWQLEQLQTDYIDYGFIHCQDELSDWQTYKKNGVLEYILDLKEKGIVKHLGLSSHTPSVINQIMDEIEIDTLMFSINPGYEFGKGDYAFGSLEEREALYRRCQKEKVGITVMKPFSGGQLLDEKLTPFDHALNIYQCMQYALDKPAVLSILPGGTSKEDIDNLIAYYEVDDETKDYSVIATFHYVDTKGKCVYCNHCKPCPVGIDIGLVNKYYDLIKVGDTLAIEHYKSLEKNADDCIGCGHCDSRCPFKVNQSMHMQEIKEYMKSLNKD